MNPPDHIAALLNKYRTQTCSQEEIMQLMKWLDATAQQSKPYTFISDQEKARLRASILSALPTSSQPQPLPRIGNTTRRWMHYAAAAIISISTIPFFRAGSTITVASAHGEIKKMILPDSSTIWLNNNSEVAYKADFKQHRSIRLIKGEVFFDVKKDATHPFTIHTGEVTTTVKGTSFSVKRIGATDVKISVVTGKVLVGKASDTLCYLLPGQRLKYTAAQNRATIDNIITTEANGWIRHNLLMQHADLSEVIQWLRDHYQITVTQNHTAATVGNYYLQVETTIQLTDMLKILNLLGKKDNVSFTLKGKTVNIQ